MRARWLARLLRDRLIERVADRRKPDFVIGGEANPYLKRWWLIPRNRVFNLYLHHFLRSDDDRALHDHPWWNVSLLLDGAYVEHLPGADMQAGYSIRRESGALVFRKARAAHRIELDLSTHMARGEEPVWTLFVTGPRIREWGFWCKQGWRHWKEFTDETGTGIGKGCGE